MRPAVEGSENKPCFSVGDPEVRICGFVSPKGALSPHWGAQARLPAWSFLKLSPPNFLHFPPFQSQLELHLHQAWYPQIRTLTGRFSTSRKQTWQLLQGPTEGGRQLVTPDGKKGPRKARHAKYSHPATHVLSATHFASCPTQSPAPLRATPSRSTGSRHLHRNLFYSASGITYSL